MPGTIKARNHYETLGVSPDAPADEIVRAFAREGAVFRPHAFGGLTELCIAYETLRDPAKRRAYDATLGFERKPVFENRSIGARQARTAAGVVPAAWIEQRTTVAPSAVPQPKPEPIGARSLGSGNDPASRTPQHPQPETRPALPLHRGEDPNAWPEPRVGQSDAPYLSLEEELGVEARPVNWRRTGAAAGAIVVAACALGGMAGWWSANDIGEVAQPENTVSVPLPPAKPVAERPAPQPVPMPVTAAKVPEAAPNRARPAIAAAVPVEPAPIVPEPTAAEVVPPKEEPAEPSLAEQTADEATAPAPAATAMPLPNRVIARTIHGIGYSCGSVASTVPVEGEAPGVYKVTCSSGQSYRASPVNGRYRFRRWGAR